MIAVTVRHRRAAMRLAAATAAALMFAADAGAETFSVKDVRFCDMPGVERPCAALPNDVVGFDSSFIYRFISEGAQFPFDLFAWQTFVALNWPLDGEGRPLDVELGVRPSAPRRWQRLARADDVLPTAETPGACGPEAPGTLTVTTFRQADGLPLIDRALNYVVYDIRLNAVARAYIEANNLGSRNGQQAFLDAKKTVGFPLGRYDDTGARRGGGPGALVIKSAWRVLAGGAAAESQSYFTRPGRIAVSAADNADGRARCIEATLALVAMHVARRTESGNGDKWIWSSFEHVDNAPLAANGREPNDLFEDTYFPGGCRAPNAPTRDFAFFRRGCANCVTNRTASANWTWAAAPPYAKAFQQPGGFGTQVTRCWRIWSGTSKINAFWRSRLAGTVWANYRLLSAQWRGNYGGDEFFGNGEVPRFLANPVIETAVQERRDGTCLGCHATARTTAGQEADFSFLLQRAR
jgi:hypothetical protein